MASKVEQTQAVKAMAVVAAADIAPKAFQQLVREGGEHQDVEDDLQVSPFSRPLAALFSPI